MTSHMIYLQFFISAGIIVWAGVRLTVYADALSERLSFGKVWVGIVLLGIVTSLPEAVASLTAVISLKAADLALGNMLGSNNINIMLIVMMDWIYRKGSVTDRISFSPSHYMPLVLAALLTLIVVGEIILSHWLAWPKFGFLSPGSILVMIVFGFSIRYLAMVGQQEKRLIPETARLPVSENPVVKISMNLAMSAALVVLGAIFLTGACDRIAFETGLGRTVVGTILLALVTSLPELVVTISALRLESLDLAIGNIFGSNMINIFIISLSDFFYRPGVLLRDASPSHIVTGVTGILLTAVAFAGIRYHGKKIFFGLGWDSYALAGLFFLGSGILFVLR